MELIKIVNAKKVYKTGVTAIQDLNLTITKGEFVFIIGSTGCGKSTLVKCFIGQKNQLLGKYM